MTFIAVLGVTYLVVQCNLSTLVVNVNLRCYAKERCCDQYDIAKKYLAEVKCHIWDYYNFPKKFFRVTDIQQKYGTPISSSV